MSTEIKKEDKASLCISLIGELADWGKHIYLKKMGVTLCGCFTVDYDKNQFKGMTEGMTSEYKNGNIVFATVDGLMTAPIEGFIQQSSEGMLYDLNRDEATVLSQIGEPTWINNYAACKVIHALKDKIAAMADYANQNQIPHSAFDKFKVSGPHQEENPFYTLRKTDLEGIIGKAPATRVNPDNDDMR